MYNSSGAKLASNDNGAPDGRNALLSFTAPLAGVYKIRVLATKNSGEYVLNINHGPQAVNDSGTTLEDTPLTLSPTANDTSGSTGIAP